MFRLQDNVPEIYVNKSRDFQLFCRLYDSVFCGVKYSADSLTHTSTSMECNNSLLGLLATKLGLFTKLNLPDRELRCVLNAFPLIIRYKGSMRSVIYIVRLFQRISRLNDLSCTVDLNAETRELCLTFSREVSNESLLYELLNYVIPTGYRIIYTFFKNDTLVTKIVSTDVFTWNTISEEAKIIGESSPGVISGSFVGTSLIGGTSGIMYDGDIDQVIEDVTEEEASNDTE